MISTENQRSRTCILYLPYSSDDLRNLCHFSELLSLNSLWARAH